MALQLALTDQFGNAYPTGYRRHVFFAFDVAAKSIVATFNNYPSKAFRDANPGLFFSQTTYRIDSTTTPSFDDFAAGDNANSQGIGSTIYGFAKMQPENAGAIDV